MSSRQGTLDVGKVVCVVLAVLGGAGVALQSRVNGALTGHLGSAYLTAFVHFFLGLLILATGLLVWPGGRAALRRALAHLRPDDDGRVRLPWWNWLGGLGGAFFVVIQAGTVPVLGVALFTVAAVAGQAIGGLVVDRVGLTPGGIRLITVGRAIGPLLTVVAVAISVWGDLDTGRYLFLAVLPMIASAGSSLQQAVNGRVRAAAQDPLLPSGPAILVASFMNFLVGTLALSVVLAVSLMIQGMPDAQWPTVPWAYAGPVLGIFFVAVSAAVVHRIGTLLLGLAMVAGQVVGALVVDAVTGYSPNAATLVATALTLVAVVVPNLAGRRRITPHPSA